MALAFAAGGQSAFWCTLLVLAACWPRALAFQARVPTAAQGAAGHPRREAERPKNVLLLMADQFRFDHLTEALTPNLFALAARGANFRRAYSSVPICPAARASLLTGLSPWKHGLRGYGDIAPRYERELPSFFKQHGYSTVAFGKNHFGFQDEAKGEEKEKTVVYLQEAGAAGPAEKSVETERRVRITHGYDRMEVYDGLNTEVDDYDRWFQEQRPNEDPMKSGNLTCAPELAALKNGSKSPHGRRPDWCWNAWRGAPVYEYEERLHPTQWTADRALNWLAKEQRGAAADVAAGKKRKPWFLKVSFHRPHSPADPPQRVFDATPAFSGEPNHAKDGWDERFRVCAARTEPDTWCGEVPPVELSLARRSYAAAVKHVDEQAGRVLKAIDPATTWVLFVSDHGDMQGDHFLWRKSVPYQGSVHVPFVLAWPTSWAPSATPHASPQPGPRDHLVELRDVFPTLASVTGLLDEDNAAALDGLDLTCALTEGHSQCGRELLDLEHGNNWDGVQPYRWNALTDGVMKYIRFAQGSDPDALPQEQMFNLSADPSEDFDLVRTGSPSEVEARLRPWRAALARQFERESRGTTWAKPGGVLVGVPKVGVLSPHYPSLAAVIPPVLPTALTPARPVSMMPASMPPKPPAMSSRRSITAMTLPGVAVAVGGAAESGYHLVGALPASPSLQRRPPGASFGLGAAFAGAIVPAVAPSAASRHNASGVYVPSPAVESYVGLIPPRRSNYSSMLDLDSFLELD